MAAPEAGGAEQRLRSDTLLTSLSGLFLYGLSAITGPLLARSLGPAGRGDLAAVLVPSEMLGWALLFGMHIAAVYHADDYPHRQLVMGSWVFSLLAGGAVVTVGWFLVPPYLHGHSPETVPWLRTMLVVAVLFVPVTTAMHLLRTRPTMMAFNVFKSVQLVIESVLIIAFDVAGHLTLTTALWAALISQVVWYVSLLTYAKAWPSLEFRLSTMRTQLSYGSRLVVADLSGLAIARLDQFILVGVVASAKLGEYTVAATAAGVSQATATGIALVMFSRVRRARDPADGWAAMMVGVRWTLLSSSLIGIAVAVLAPVALPLLFGSAFRGAITPLWLLIPGEVAFDVGNAISQKLMADNRPATVSRAMALAAIVTVVGLAITVHPWGIIGAAIVTSVSQFVFLGYLWVAVVRHHRAVLAGQTVS